jgi:hypothetical protein
MMWYDTYLDLNRKYQYFKDSTFDYTDLEAKCDTVITENKVLGIQRIILRWYGHLERIYEIDSPNNSVNTNQMKYVKG